MLSKNPNEVIAKKIKKMNEAMNSDEAVARLVGKEWCSKCKMEMDVSDEHYDPMLHVHVKTFLCSKCKRTKVEYGPR